MIENFEKKTINNYGNTTIDELKKWEQKHYPQTLSEDEINDYLKWYAGQQESYNSLAKKVKEILEDVILKRNITIQDISYRGKTLESFEGKIRKKSNYNPKDMQDLSGIRVICYTKSDAIAVCNAIYPNFDINHKKLIDQSRKLGTTEMGYASFNFDATFTKERIKSSEELSDFQNSIWNGDKFHTSQLLMTSLNQSLSKH